MHTHSENGILESIIWGLMNERVQFGYRHGLLPQVHTKSVLPYDIFRCWQRSHHYMKNRRQNMSKVSTCFVNLSPSAYLANLSPSTWFVNLLHQLEFVFCIYLFSLSLIIHLKGLKRNVFAVCYVLFSLYISWLSENVGIDIYFVTRKWYTTIPARNGIWLKTHFDKN